MGVFLGLGQPELGQPMRRHPFAQRVDDARAWGRPRSCRRCGRPSNPPSPAAPPAWAGPVSKALKSGSPMAARISRARSARKFRQKKPVAVAASPRNRRSRSRAGIHRSRPCRHSPRRWHRQRGGRAAPALDDGAIGAAHPLPAIVAVHREVAPGHGGDAGVSWAARPRRPSPAAADFGARRARR
jgi:hypothetical protein